MLRVADCIADHPARRTTADRNAEHRKSDRRRDDHDGDGFRKWTIMLVELLVTCRLIWWVRPISSFPLFGAAFSRLLDRPFNNFDGRNCKQNGSVVIHRVTNKGLYL